MLTAIAEAIVTEIRQTIYSEFTILIPVYYVAATGMPEWKCDGETWNGNICNLFS